MHPCSIQELPSGPGSDGEVATLLPVPHTTVVATRHSPFFSSGSLSEVRMLPCQHQCTAPCISAAADQSSERGSYRAQGMNRRCWCVEGWREEILNLFEGYLGVYSGLASALLTPPRTQPEPLGHLRKMAISSRGSWWSALDWGDFSCP